MLKEKSVLSRLNLLGGCFLLILPFMLLACGEEAATPVTNQTTAVANATNVSPVSPGKPVVTQSQVSVQATAGVTTTAAVPSKATIKPAISAASGKAPSSGEAACALVTNEQASAVLGVVLDRSVPDSRTGFSCNYYAGEQLLLQVFFEKVKGGRSLIDSHKLIYPDAKLISGVGDYNLWSAESGRFDLLQGSSNFDIVILSGETDKAKLLDQATKVAQLVISQIK